MQNMSVPSLTMWYIFTKKKLPQSQISIHTRSYTLALTSVNYFVFKIQYMCVTPVHRRWSNGNSQVNSQVHSLKLIRDAQTFSLLNVHILGIKPTSSQPELGARGLSVTACHIGWPVSSTSVYHSCPCDSHFFFKYCPTGFCWSSSFPLARLQHPDHGNACWCFLWWAQYMSRQLQSLCSMSDNRSNCDFHSTSSLVTGCQGHA